MAKKKASRKSHKSAKPVKVGFFQAIRDVLIASLNRGQFPLAIFAVILGLIIWRMPEARVADLADEILRLLATGSLLGYILAFALVVSWTVHARSQRRTYENEMRRMSYEKKRLQRKLTDTNISSSEKGR